MEKSKTSDQPNQDSEQQEELPEQKEQLRPGARQGAVKRVIKVPLPQILRKKMQRVQEDKDEWQPKTLVQCRDQQQHGKSNSSAAIASKLAKSFMLPKPKNSSNEGLHARSNSNHFKKPPPKPLIDMSKPTEQQLKWDVEDQSFIVTQIAKPPDNPNLKERFQGDDQTIRQDDLPDDFKGRPISNVRMEQLVDADWQQKEKQRKMRLTLWQGAADTVATVTGVNREKNQINSLLEDAMKRAEEIDFEMGKRAGQRMMMKKRYGW